MSHETEKEQVLRILREAGGPLSSRQIEDLGEFVEIARVSGAIHALRNERVVVTIGDGPQRKHHLAEWLETKPGRFAAPPSNNDAALRTAESARVDGVPNNLTIGPAPDIPKMDRHVGSAEKPKRKYARRESKQDPQQPLVQHEPVSERTMVSEALLKNKDATRAALLEYVRVRKDTVLEALLECAGAAADAYREHTSRTIT